MNNTATHNIDLNTHRVKAATHYDTEPCGVKGCGKLIYFTCEMTRTGYTYRRDVKGKRKYYCGWGHFQEDRPEVKVKSKNKGGY